MLIKGLFKISLTAVAAVLLSGCGSVATIRPLEVGQSALALSVGGPLSEVPGIGTFPVPYSNIRYRWGVLDRLEAHIGVHPTVMVYGALGMDVGLSYLLFDQKEAIPAACLGLNPTFWVNPFYGAVFFAPELEAAFSWQVHPRIMLYTGAQSFIQLEKPYFPWAVLVGTEVRLGQIGLTVEAKWYAPTEATVPRVVYYPADVSNHGALGGVVGISFYPGGVND